MEKSAAFIKRMAKSVRGVDRSFVEVSLTGEFQRLSDLEKTFYFNLDVNLILKQYYLDFEIRVILCIR